MQYKIRELELAGVLDQSIAVVRNNFGLLFQILLMTWIPWNVFQSLITISILPKPPRGGPPEEALRFLFEVMGHLPWIYGLVFFGFLFVMPIANAAVIYSVAEIYLGKKVTAVGALKKALSRIGPLMGTSILTGMLVTGGFVLCVLPGILCALWFGLSQHVVMLESMSGLKAMMRSKELVSPYMGMLLMLGLVVVAITTSVGAGAAFIPQQHVQLLVAITLNSIATIFSTAVFVIFYFSCRCGVENFDLEHLAASVGESIEPPTEVGETFEDPVTE